MSAANPYKRAKPTLSSRNRILIITEGAETEPRYLDALCARLEFKSCIIEHPPATDPVSLVNFAIRRKGQLWRDSRAKIDHVWVVFDLERTHDQRRELAKKAAPVAAKANVQLALSDPCFEYWVLLHFEPTTAPMSSCDDAYNRVRSHARDYHKGWGEMKGLMPKVPVAVANARRCRAHHASVGGDGNPFTEADKLVVLINSLARPEYQLELEPEGATKPSTRRHGPRR